MPTHPLAGGPAGRPSLRTFHLAGGRAVHASQCDRRFNFGTKAGIVEVEGDAVIGMNQDMHVLDQLVVLRTHHQLGTPDTVVFKALKRIGDGMRPGGILILSEKILFEDAHLQALNTDLHHAFKKANGYSDMEISQKRTSIENVLLPETIQCHEDRLRDAGFKNIDVWFQCFNFASLVAIK